MATLRDATDVSLVAVWRLSSRRAAGREDRAWVAACLSRGIGYSVESVAAAQARGAWLDLMIVLRANQVLTLAIRIIRWGVLASS